MPFDALGRTRATLKEATRSLPRGGQARSSVRSRAERFGQPLNLLWPSLAPRGRNWGLKLCPMNQEFPVSASQQLALITSLPFVHTARRYYRSSDVVRLLDRSGTRLQRLFAVVCGLKFPGKMAKLDRSEEVKVVTRFP
jgi:hypothetical protein